MKTLYHGSPSIIENPEHGKGNPRNDYGLGFYCTESIEPAREWACLTKSGGFVNIYTIDTTGLNILNLSESSFTILRWLAILVNNRTLRTHNRLAAQAKEYLRVHFLPDVSIFDVITGYRADDSYFAFAMDFLNNTISIKQLDRAMHLGKLGQQFMIRSKKAFEILRFIGSEKVDGEIYYAKRLARDNEARKQYLQEQRNATALADDLFMIDILREEIKQDDARLQSAVFG